MSFSVYVLDGVTSKEINIPETFFVRLNIIVHAEYARTHVRERALVIQPRCDQFLM